MQLVIDCGNSLNICWINIQDFWWRRKNHGKTELKKVKHQGSHPQSHYPTFHPKRSLQIAPKPVHTLHRADAKLKSSGKCAMRLHICQNQAKEAAERCVYCALGCGDVWGDVCDCLLLGMGLGENQCACYSTTTKTQYSVRNSITGDWLGVVIISDDLSLTLWSGFFSTVCTTDSSGVTFLGVFAVAYHLRKKKTFVGMTQRWRREQSQSHSKNRRNLPLRSILCGSGPKF